MRIDQNASEVRKLLTVESRGSTVPLAECEENEFVQLLSISTEEDLEEMERKLEKDIKRNESYSYIFGSFF